MEGGVYWNEEKKEIEDGGNGGMVRVRGNINDY